MMKNQLADLMKQAQAMQDSMKKAQEAIAAMEVEGEAGAGLVKVVMTGRHDVRRVTIDPSLLGEDKDMLEDLVAAAINDAVRKVEAASQDIAEPRRALDWHAASLQRGDVAVDRADRHLELVGECRRCDRMRDRAQRLDNVEQAIGSAHPRS